MTYEKQEKEDSLFTNYISTSSLKSNSLYSSNVSSTAKPSSLGFGKSSYSNTGDTYLSKTKDNYKLSKINNNIINADKQYSFMINKQGDLNGTYAKAHGGVIEFNTAPYLYVKLM